MRPWNWMFIFFRTPEVPQVDLSYHLRLSALSSGDVLTSSPEEESKVLAETVLEHPAVHSITELCTDRLHCVYVSPQHCYLPEHKRS